MENDIIRLINLHGPLTGGALLEHVGVDILRLWRTCSTSIHLLTKKVARYYLRLDRNTKNLARISPSIKREFLTYTLVGLREDPDSLELAGLELRKKIDSISKRKLEFTREIVETICRDIDPRRDLASNACFILAGDIVYSMAHGQPRPERSTGRMINGSDIDLVVVCKDGFPDDAFRELDQQIYKKKYHLLIHPDFREELDYTIKSFAKVKEQTAFKTFESMVACKILAEGKLIAGSEELFRSITEALATEQIPGKLGELEMLAKLYRRNAEDNLLFTDDRPVQQDFLKLFYTTQETDENK